MLLILFNIFPHHHNISPFLLVMNQFFFNLVFHNLQLSFPEYSTRYFFNWFPIRDYFNCIILFPPHWILCPLMKLKTNAISISPYSSRLNFLLHVPFSLLFRSTHYSPNFIFKSSKFSFHSVDDRACFTTMNKCRI